MTSMPFSFIYIQIVVDFAALWCAPCRFMSPILSELAEKMPGVIFLKVDVDGLKVTKSVITF